MRLVAEYCSALSFCVGRAEREKKRRRDDETTRPRDDETTRPRDCETTRLRDHETTRPRDYETTEKPRRSQAFSGVLSRARQCAIERG